MLLFRVQKIHKKERKEGKEGKERKERKKTHQAGTVAGYTFTFKEDSRGKCFNSLCPQLDMVLSCGRGKPYKNELPIISAFTSPRTHVLSLSKRLYNKFITTKPTPKFIQLIIFSILYFLTPGRYYDIFRPMGCKNAFILQKNIPRLETEVCKR